MQTSTKVELDPDRYRANIRQWQVGDLVIHSGDDKHHSMLMRVIGFTRDGRVKTQYINPDYRHISSNTKSTRKIWTNPLSALLDPKKFGIEVTQ
jgi:hypothetical protein